METTIEKVREFATEAHSGQLRKYSPEPYIVHPIRVMETCRRYDPSLPVLAAALLHDVIEDTAVNEKTLSEFLYQTMPADDAAKTLQLVVELTDVYVKSAYPNLNRRRRKDKEIERMSQISPEAQTVKYADILDNVKEIAADDPSFAPRYVKECLAILRKINKGDQSLYERVMSAVSQIDMELRT